MSATAYKRILLTGGSADALDSVDGADLKADDFAIIFKDGVNYYYLYKNYGTPQTESSPDIIVPDSNAGNFAWQRQEMEYSIGLINEDATLYLAVTGDDNLGEGTLENPWYSLEKAFDYLKDKFIYTNTTVTISIGVGTFSNLNPVVIDHPNLNCINITGAGKDITVLLFAGEGLLVSGGGLLDVFEELTIKGSSTSSYTGLDILYSSVLMSNVKFDTWENCVSANDNSYFSIASGDFFNFFGGILCDQSIANINADFNGNDVGIRAIGAVRNSNITITGFCQLSNVFYGCYADVNSFIDADGVDSNGAFFPYTPATTNSSSAEPTWDNWGSWIMQ